MKDNFVIKYKKAYYFVRTLDDWIVSARDRWRAAPGDERETGPAGP